MPYLLLLVKNKEKRVNKLLHFSTHLQIYGLIVLY